MEVPVQEEGRAKMGGVAEVVGGTRFSSQPTEVEFIEVNVDSIDLVNVYTVQHQCLWVTGQQSTNKNIYIQKSKGSGTWLSRNQLQWNPLRLNNYKVNVNTIDLVNLYCTVYIVQHQCLWITAQHSKI